MSEPIAARFDVPFVSGHGDPPEPCLVARVGLSGTVHVVAPNGTVHRVTITATLRELSGGLAYYRYARFVEPSPSSPRQDPTPIAGCLRDLGALLSTTREDHKG